MSLAKLEDLGDRLVVTSKFSARRNALTPEYYATLQRALVTAACDTDIARQLDRERDEIADAVAAPEAAEGIDAFLNKRPPDFAKLRGLR
jgi:enoyl-CoA hydratase/carnithine racemase